MRLLFKILLCFFISFFIRSKLLAQLVITPQANAQALAQRLVGNGVNISNVVLNASFKSTGFFNNISGTNIGIDSGIVLTNGVAKSGRGVNGMDGNGAKEATNVLADNDVNFPGDADLDALINKTTEDACVLEFDFVPLGDSIKFNYVFGSEEYPYYACSNFNDAFAFFITGPGFPTLTNIALIPGSTAPVTINNINDSSCAAYPQFFVANYTNTFFNYNGHTKVFTALAQVQPCQTYHLKLVIADVGDPDFDSGVFLQAKSLSSNAVALQNTTQIDQQNNSYLVEGCSAGSFKIKRPEEGFSPLVVTLSYGGTAINGVDVQLLPNTITIPPGQSEVVVNVVPIVDNIPEGIEFLKVYALAGCNAATPSDSTVIQIRDYDTLGIFPDTAIICKRSSIQLLASAGYTTYQWDANPTLNNVGIRNPIATPTTNNTTYYCTSTEGACHGRDSSFLIWKELGFLSKKDINCKGASTGEIKVTGGPLWAKPVQYAIDNGAYQDDSTFSNLPVGTYSVKIKDAANCIDSISVILNQLYPDLTIANLASTPASCSGNADGTATITVSGGNAPYLFSSDGITFQTIMY
ncbi:MAG: choice-of-anchor L domain-containing protein [Ferruginibacter sp.]